MSETKPSPLFSSMQQKKNKEGLKKNCIVILDSKP